MTLVYCGQTVGWIRMRIVTEVGLGPGHIVLDGDPQKGAQQPPLLFGPIVAKRSPITAEVLCLAINSAAENVNVARVNGQRSLDCRQASVNCCQRLYELYGSLMIPDDNSNKSSQSNFTRGCIVATHGRFNPIRQVAPRCNPLNTCFLGPPKSITQTTSRPVQPCLHGSLV